MTAQPNDGHRSNPGHEHLSDPDLMLLIRHGEPSALEALMGRYWAPLVRYAARLVHSVDSAEDMVQDTFLTVWRERASWKPVGTPQAFLYRIVRNSVLQELRTSEARGQKAPEIARRRPPVPTPFEITAGEELDRAFQQALTSLPDRRREAFVLVRYHKLSLADVAEIMGVSTQTVSNHVSMAVAELRRALQRFLT